MRKNMIQYKKTKRKIMLRYISTSIIVLVFTACKQDSIVLNIKEKPLTEVNITTISKVTIPVREHGYRNFETTLLTSQKSFNDFIKEVENQKYWNKKSNFLDSIQLKKINFNLYNLLIYRLTNSSGSTILQVDPPLKNKNNITIKIGKNKSDIGTTDMANYALAYKISKSIKNITFENGVKKDIIKNSASSTSVTIPNSCLEWFDGCNSCSRTEKESLPICTEKLCKVYKKFKCTKWKEHPKQPTPEGVPSHHDIELESLPRSPQFSNE